jgi:hypothetical protein
MTRRRRLSTSGAILGRAGMATELKAGLP